jgi:hypothetical protein
VRIIAFAAITLCLYAGLAAFASQTVIAGMFKPGGILDPSRTARVSLDLDGRPLRITIGTAHWDFEQGNADKAFALKSGSSPFLAARGTSVTIQLVGKATRIIGNGDPDYPRWDGTAWLFDAAGSAPLLKESTLEPGRSGRLFVRNLTSSRVTIRVLSPKGTPVSDTSWYFDPFEAANDPQGHYLELNGAPLRVSQDNRLEIIMKNGAHRIIPVAAIARWGSSGSWLMEMVPERLAGAGKLFVKNVSEAPIRLWLMGADGQALFGEDPWTFEPKEGTGENKGLRLQFEEKDVTMTGRETVKLEVQDLRTVLTAPLERIAAWRGRAWTIDLSKAVR